MVSYYTTSGLTAVRGEVFVSVAITVFIWAIPVLVSKNIVDKHGAMPAPSVARCTAGPQPGAPNSNGSQRQKLHPMLELIESKPSATEMNNALIFAPGCP